MFLRAHLSARSRLFCPESTPISTPPVANVVIQQKTRNEEASRLMVQDVLTDVAK